MKKYVVIFITIVLASLTGCADAFNDDAGEPLFLEVELSVQPTEVQPGDPVKFEAKVTYGEETVTDADDVKFEFWRAHDENHEVVIVERAEDGVYQLEESFTEEGTYYVISHVTGRNMHNMPKEEFIVGEASEPEDGYNSQVMEFDGDDAIELDEEE